MNSIHINHRGESLNYQIVVGDGENKITEPMTGQALYKHAKACLEDSGECNIVAQSGTTLSGVLKQISAIRAWGDILPKVRFQIQDAA